MMKEQEIGIKVTRSWGHYTVLYEGKGFKVKELVISPNSSLSKQRHTHRSETWNIVKGECYVILNDSKENFISDNKKIQLTVEKGIHIPVNTWHKGINESDKPAHIIEIWRGEVLTEDDIERVKLVM